MCASSANQLQCFGGNLVGIKRDLRDIISQEGKVLDYETVRERRKASGFFRLSVVGLERSTTGR